MILKASFFDKAPRLMRRSYYLFFLLLLSACQITQEIQYATIYSDYSKEGLNARALAIVGEEAVIVAGPKGYFCGKYFGGDLVEQPSLVGAADIRDLQLFDDGTMSMMSSGDTARIYHVDYNGKQSLVYDSAGIFLDGMDFWDATSGIVYGDPVRSHFFLALTNNAGQNWTPLYPDVFPSILTAEAGFAASGTGLQCLGDSTVYFATGMADTARLFCSYDRGKTWVAKNTPMKSGDSFGIYSIYFWSEQEGMIVGGSWKETEYNKKICYYTADGGNTWVNRSKGLGGYLSCINGNQDGSCLFTTGDQGTFFSLDKGITWSLLFDKNYYSIALKGEYAVFIGRNGVLEIIRYKY